MITELIGFHLYTTEKETFDPTARVATGGARACQRYIANTSAALQQNGAFLWLSFPQACDINGSETGCASPSPPPSSPPTVLCEDANGTCPSEASLPANSSARPTESVLDVQNNIILDIPLGDAPGDFWNLSGSSGLPEILDLPVPRKTVVLEDARYAWRASKWSKVSTKEQFRATAARLL